MAWLDELVSGFQQGRQDARKRLKPLGRPARPETLREIWGEPWQGGEDADWGDFRSEPGPMNDDAALRTLLGEVAAIAEQSEAERAQLSCRVDELEAERVTWQAYVAELEAERATWPAYAGELQSAQSYIGKLQAELESDRRLLGEAAAIADQRQARIAELEAAPDALDEILESAYGETVLRMALHPDPHPEASAEQRRQLNEWAKMVNARIAAKRKNRREAA